MGIKIKAIQTDACLIVTERGVRHAAGKELQSACKVETERKHCWRSSAGCIVVTLQRFKPEKGMYFLRQLRCCQTGGKEEREI